MPVKTGRKHTGITRLRQAQRWSWGNLVTESGVQKKDILALEAGIQEDPAPWHLRALARVFKVSVDQLY